MMNPPYNKALNRFALFTAVCTWVLIIAGGLVTSTGSGLAVPDWPLSYGKIMPPMVGGIFYEHGHRMVATFVGILTVILSVWLWKKEQRKWVRNLGFIALGSVILQGVLGGLTVRFLLPAPISVTHATLAQTFFLLVSIVALVTSKWWMVERDPPENPSLRSLAFAGAILLAAIYVQLVLGALMRHTESGLAIPDFPLAYGQIWPSISAESMARYNQEQLRADLRLAAQGPLSEQQVLFNMLHRAWALVVIGMVIRVSLEAFRNRVTDRRLTLFAWLLPSLTLIQIFLGAATVLSRMEVDITTAHVANGALMLVTTTMIVCHAARLGGSQVSLWHKVVNRREVLA